AGTPRLWARAACISRGAPGRGGSRRAPPISRPWSRDGSSRTTPRSACASITAHGAPSGPAWLPPASRWGCAFASMASAATLPGTRASRIACASLCRASRRARSCAAVAVCRRRPTQRPPSSPRAPALPEGYAEAFAPLYRDYADILTARRGGAAPDPLALLAPTVEDGVRGLAFVEAALQSGKQGGGWVALPS